MAWVTMVSKAGTKIKIPEPVYNNMYSWNESYSLFEEPKPTPKFEELTKEVVDDEQIHDTQGDEVKSVRKSTKKTIS